MFQVFCTAVGNIYENKNVGLIVKLASVHNIVRTAFNAANAHNFVLPRVPHVVT